MNNSFDLTNLRNSEFEMFSFFEKTPDLVCIANKAGFFKKVNDAVIEKLGYTNEELFARPIASFIHPDDMEITGRKRQELLEGKALIDFQNRYIAKNGDSIWLHWTSLYFPDKEVVFAIAKDITESKLREKEIEDKYIKFKSLATHFKASLEKDRKYLAIELHEELAQLATVVKMDVYWVADNTPGLPEVSKKRIDHSLAIIDLLINAIRKITYSISPKMLDDLGLNDTLKWLCDEFSVLNGMPCTFESNYDDERLTSEIKLDLFRICQESLNNVSCHAEANTVRVSIETVGNGVSLCITDDGKGFDVAQQKKSYGLTNIRKRAASINGQVSIQSDIGKGTSVCVTINDLDRSID